MISTLTKLKVCDNSGVKHAKCFKVYKTFWGTIGSLVYVSIKESKNNNKYKKKISLKKIYNINGSIEYN